MMEEHLIGVISATTFTKRRFAPMTKITIPTAQA